jgi:hypothetical protein
MDQWNEQELHLHVTILGWLYIATGAICLLIGLCGFLFLTGIGLIPAANGDPEALAILSIIGTVGLLFFGALALPDLLAGYGLLKGAKWGQILGIIVGILNLASFPIGTAIGIYTLWVLFQNSATAYFAQQEDAL